MKTKSLIVSAVLALAAAAAIANPAAKKAFQAAGTFVEGCSCSAPCPCELVGVKMGCEGVGALAFTGGKYDGVDLAGAKVAYATVPGTWVRLYVDAKDAKQKAAAKAFATAIYSAFGKIEATKDAKIAIGGAGGKYTTTVDGGKVFKLTTEPVLGGDKKTPLVYSNINDPLHSTVMQGKTISCTFKDGNRSFTIKGTNSYFNPGFKSSGNI